MKCVERRLLQFRSKFLPISTGENGNMVNNNNNKNKKNIVSNTNQTIFLRKQKHVQYSFWLWDYFFVIVAPQKKTEGGGRTYTRTNKLVYTNSFAVKKKVEALSCLYIVDYIL